MIGAEGAGRLAAVLGQCASRERGGAAPQREKAEGVVVQALSLQYCTCGDTGRVRTVLDWVALR